MLLMKRVPGTMKRPATMKRPSFKRPAAKITQYTPVSEKNKAAFQELRRVAEGATSVSLQAMGKQHLSSSIQPCTRADT